MRRRLQDIWNSLPRYRSRRMWYYVSPRRRGLNLTALAVLVLMVYGYWRQTNDQQIRKTAERYLGQLTAARVKIGKARFSLFGGMELQNVSLYVRGSKAPDPVFRAKKVLMRHRPWELLVGGRVSPTEIVCLEPLVILEYRTQAGTYNVQDMVLRARQDGTIRGPDNAKLPSIVVRQGSLRIVDVDGDLRVVAGEVGIEASMAPQGQDEYVIAFEERTGPGLETVKGRVILDLRSGQITQVSGMVPLASLDKTLPQKYRRWRQLYEVTGEVRITRKVVAGGADTLTAELMDVSMKFPRDEGGLELAGVRGQLVFDPEGVTLRSVTGRVTQAGGARFEMSGRYTGYEPSGPYRLSVKVLEMTVPDFQDAEGQLAVALRDFRETYQPSGAMDLWLEMSRDGDGKVTCTGWAEPKGMSMLFRHFPYRVDNVRGKISFAPGRVDLQGLTAQRGGGSFTIDGQVNFADSGSFYDLTVKADDAPLDENLRQGMPKSVVPFWDALSPAGRVSAVVRICRRPEDQQQTMDVHVVLKGLASMTYRGFPYRLDELTGNVHISDGNVRIQSVKGARGAMRCSINGTLKAVDTAQREVDLTIEGSGLPLDDSLADAIGQKGRDTFLALRPKGSADRFSARLWQTGGGNLQYDILVNLRDAAFNLKAFPYEMNNTAGAVTIRPGKVVIEGIRGTHGEAAISAAGLVYLNDGQVGLDVQVKATGVSVDEDLYQALPPDFKKAWAELSPSGKADMSLLLQHNLPDRPGQAAYDLTVEARGMSASFSRFPYALEGITGRAVAKPGQIVLQKLSYAVGSMRGCVDGVVLFGGDGLRAELAVTGTNVPIDAKLLSSLPADFAPLASRLEPGGTCDIDLRKVAFHRPKARSTSTPASSQTETAPGKPSIPAVWSAEGSVTVRDAAINVGLGRKTITGSISGTGVRNEQGLALQADISLQKVVVGEHQVTDLSARLTKGPATSIMEIENISARAAEGLLAGYARIELSRPLRYGINLSIERMRLERLFGQGKEQDPAEPGVTGLLDGRIELTENAGDAASRQAVGVLRISQARLYRKLPVLLDLFTVEYLALPHGAPFSEGEFTYHLRGEQLIFNEICLRGASLSLVGSGRMHMKTRRLDLTFLTGPPGKLPRLSGLADELLSGIIRQIVEIQVTGTLSDPRTRTVPLRSLKEAVDRLLSPSRQQY